MNKVGNILDLDGRVALVTGAGQGVGRQIALHLGSYNAGGVIVNDFYRERAEAVAAEVSELGVAAMPAQADVGDFKSVQAMVDAATKKIRTDRHARKQRRKFRARSVSRFLHQAFL